MIADPSVPAGRLAYAAVFAAALAVEWQRGGGSSPLLCPDSFADQGRIERCLAGGGCDFAGLGSSVPGFVNPSGWLHVRALLAAAGLDIDAVHALILLGNAFAAVLTMLAAERLGGRRAGLLAAVIFVGWILPLSERDTWVNNTAALPLLGAVFLATFLRALQRPKRAALLLTALTGGVLASIYASAAPALVSVALLGALAPGVTRRLATSLVGAFAIVAYLAAPAGWRANVEHLLTPSGSMPGVGASNLGLDGILVLVATGAVVEAWRRAARSSPPLHRAMHGPLAVMLPPVALLYAAAVAGRVAFDLKYIAHVGPAAAVAAALPAAAVAAALPAAALLATRAAAPARPRGIARRLVIAAVACLIVIRVGMALFGAQTAQDAVTTADVRGVASVLRDHGWTWPKALRSLQTPERNALRALYPLLPQQPDDEDALAAILLHVPFSALPQPLPPNWTVAHVAGHRATVLVFTPSWLDWRAIRVCRSEPSAPGEHCESTGRVRHDPELGQNPVRVEGFPLPMQSSNPITVRLHVPVSVPADAGAGEQRIAMRTLEMACHGRIAAVEQPNGGGSTIAADGASAVLVADSHGAPSSVVFEWILGGPDCPSYTVDQFPPFVLEGDPQTVATVEQALTQWN